MLVEKKIEAVEFLLGSYFGSPSENERTALIVKQFEATKNEYLKTYAEFSKAELKEQLIALQGQLSDSIVLPSSPNFTPSVWILCKLNPLEAVGTAWIASDRKVVTVFHNIAKDPQNSTSRAVLKANWAVVSKLERVQGHVCVPRGSVVVPVKLAKLSVPNDWAVMECEDQLTFPPSLVLKVCEVGEIPVDGSEAKLKVFHCPVSMFNEGHLDVCGCTSLESRLSLKTAHKMYVEVGMFRGSSGGIFAFTIPGGEHRVLGMHSEGRNTAQSIEDVQAEDPDLSALEAAAVASDSCANNHGSFSMGIIVAKYGPLLAAIRA